MDRRDFIRGTGGVLAAAALQGKSALAGERARDTMWGRSVLAMNRGWRYHPGKVDGAAAPGFDDSGFSRVVIPHSNVRLPWHSFDDKEYEFVSTYRRRFRLPQSARGKRVFVDFEGAMTASTAWINGVRLGEYKGGYTPFSFELTPHLHAEGENVLCVEVDSTERPDIPPFGNEIDYLTFGGIYREVSLRIVPSTYIDNVFAHGRDVLTGSPSLDVDCFLAGQPQSGMELEVELRDGERVIATGKQAVPENAALAARPSQPSGPVQAPVHATEETTGDPARQTVSLAGLSGVQLWDLQHPHLYTVNVRLLRDGRIVDEDSRRIGFREATFTDHGFSLNGKIVKLRGLDRHQTFPFVGQAMPARGQRQDAKILRKVLHCNIVRTSHYPQSRHFLDCCDEVGLLVLEEIPGWQHIGDEEWKQVAVDNVGRMIRRDWN
ncbi:MAG: glycoside hydrolase family 2 TIM barrel-domain containing protein, partial [Acidobacteriaceae bacterium]